MQVGQRLVLTIVLILVLFSAKMIPGQQQEERRRRQWQEIQTERFLGKIAETGYCTYNEFLMYSDALNFDGECSEIQLEEYQKEKNRYGKTYWYLVSWGEILSALTEDGVFYFRQGSAVEVKIERKVGLQERTYRYCDVIS